jgi:hypothetical protein
LKLVPKPKNENTQNATSKYESVECFYLLKSCPKSKEIR